MTRTLAATAFRIAAAAMLLGCTQPPPRGPTDSRFADPPVEACRGGTLISNARPGSYRLVPELRNGTPVGWRFYSVSPSSVMSKAGVRNGDLLLISDGGPSAAQCLDGAELQLRRGAQEVRLRFPTL
jgi:hypothetical protein